MAKEVPLDQLRGRYLGRVLIKKGILTRNVLHECIKLQKSEMAGQKLGQILISQGHITEQQLNVALAAQRGMEYTEIEGMELSDEVASTIPQQMATSYRIVPVDFSKSDNLLTIAIDDPNNFRATDELKSLMGYNVKAVVTSKNSLDQVLDRYYSKDKGNINEIIGEIEKDSFLTSMEGRDESIDLDEISELAESSSVKKLLNLVLIQAINDKASDIHFEPFEESYRMRYRIDGVLYEMVPPPKHIAVALSSRVKVMADLDISERRLPQDGRISLTLNNRQVDMRVSILPTVFGESVVLRVLDRSQIELTMSELGLGPREVDLMEQVIGRPNGIIIVTGPTGSGKTTTLYAGLKELNSIERKVITTEDPVEYDVEGLHQVQIRTDIGLTFPACLRSILRQDPDVIMVGEIRDFQTAQISAEAALTGHLVLTTVHTNDAPSAVARLLDLGLEKFLVTATVEAIVAQRLVRRVCQNCKREYEPAEEELMELGLTPSDVKGKKFYRGRGCDVCNNTGYKGRLGIFEIMAFNDEIRDLIMNDASTAVLRNAARKGGMRLLRESGLRAIYDGLTTIEEVVKETIADEE
ncbi:GspE/PulE family protein [Sedimentisphaera salicampi]|uniref:Type II traffic warden ATPase n=1 Tax=Sedimentisphaera salicampi TaxID=1941349 RepID=A0A1W6LPD3_9BACT|nr:ATPase, T2SS/T4P/T4SS family [Sedimentisphaera salicampi]ARN57627.1 Type II traffic warden ATPase [Sedimentisphaera salicampi]OXU14195.1 Type II traffic warden ATPase [Sedimentisphaera salicampi]